MERNDRRTQGEWAVILADWQKSGETQRGYCRRNDIKFTSFHYWRNKQRRKGRDNSLVKVSSRAKPVAVSGNAPTVRAGEIQVRLSGQESEELLTRIFKALRASR